MKITELAEDIMCKTDSGNIIYWLITTEMGAKGFELRYIEIPIGGRSSYGSHAHEHEVFIVKGKGKIEGSDYEEELRPYMAVFVSGGEEHQWINTGSGPFGFVCVVTEGAEAELKPPCGKK